MRNFSNKTGQRGFVKLLVSIIIALIVLSYLGFDLRSVIEAPQTQENLRYFWDLMQNIWWNYIWQGILFVWNKIIIEYIWGNIVLIWQAVSSNF